MSPVAGNLVIAWSVNGVANYEQSDASFNFVIAAGEEKTISVVVAQGACSASNAITVVGCGDCSNFDAQVRIIDSGRRDVSTQDCLPAGIYTVQATAPAGAGNTFRWSINNVVDNTATGPSISVALGESEQKVVTLEARRGECSDTASVALLACVEQRTDDGFIPCLLFKILALLGLGLIFLGAGLAVLWGRRCEVSRCRVLSEWISLFTFVVNVVAILETVLAACVITSMPIPAFIWALVIGIFQAWLWFVANRRGCIRN